MTLAEAIELARRAHAGQLDKAGEPYIGHPLRVMSRVQGTSARMTAVLHDVAEDTSVTLADLRRLGCPDDVVTAVTALTRVRGEDSDSYYARVSPVGQKRPPAVG